MYKDRNGMEIEVMLNENIITEMEKRMNASGLDDIVTDFVKALIDEYTHEKRISEEMDKENGIEEDSCFAGSVYLYCPLRVLRYVKENRNNGIIPDEIGKYILSDFQEMFEN